MGLIAAIVIIGIVIVISVLAANFIWDAAHDVSAGNIDIELISCKKTGTGSTETVVKISNHNNFLKNNPLSSSDRRSTCSDLGLITKS